jgi:hypothetical protein
VSISNFSFNFKYLFFSSLPPGTAVPITAPLATSLFISTYTRILSPYGFQ